MIIVSDLRDVSLKALVIVSLLFLAFCDQSGISSYCDGVTILNFLFVLFSLVSFSFLFFPSLFFSFLGHGLLFGLVDLILALILENRARHLNFFKLIVVGLFH